MTEATETVAAPAVPETLTLDLRKPIKSALGEEIMKLELREPTAAQMIEAEKATGMESDVQLISHVTGIPAGSIRTLGARDFFAAARFLAGFAGNDPASGESA